MGAAYVRGRRLFECGAHSRTNAHTRTGVLLPMCKFRPELSFRFRIFFLSVFVIKLRSLFRGAAEGVTGEADIRTRRGTYREKSLHVGHSILYLKAMFYGLE